MWRRIREIMRKEFRQSMREPRMLATMFMPPLMQLIVFGYAVNMDVNSVRVAWLDQDRTPQSRQLQARFEGSGYFDIVAVPVSGGKAGELMELGKVQGVISLLPGFGGDVKRGHATTVQVLVDGTDSNTASIISNYATQVISGYASDVAVAHRKAPSGLPHIEMQSRVWFNDDLRSRNYFVPGVVVNIITLVTLMLTAMAVVREKEIGTMEQLMVTPIRPIELILGKTLPFALIGLFDTIMVTVAALVVFQVPLRGNLLLLLLGACLFLMTTLGMGLFLSTVSHTQQQAMMSSFFFFLPAFMLSGFAFLIRNMPLPVQWLTLVNPVRYFMEIVRGIFLKGSGISVLWPQMVAMTIFGAAILLFSASRFHKRLD